MFASLLNRLTNPGSAPLPDTDARLALAALLVRIAKSDGHYDADEIAQIEHTLAARYQLSQHQAAELRVEAEAFEAEAPDTVRFTRAIKDAVPLADRTGVLEAMWQVVLADGARDKNEDQLMRLAANLLGINDRDSALARQRVEAGS
ncbi:TerB family tellurite resistance protein [Aliiroseovarius sp. PTFE2010]|uniref:tellurite resistance TerB family protein n=1 Tax=Aliiroseovarius sp. PTFE2010 TaxID=3417190 RepID=UPI003CE8B350